MNKRILKTALFIIGGIVVLLFVTALLWFILTVIMAAIIVNIAKNAGPYVVAIVPMVSLIGGFFIYNEIYKRVVSHIDMEKHFHEVLWKKDDK